jgi:MFS family permease
MSIDDDKASQHAAAPASAAAPEAGARAGQASTGGRAGEQGVDTGATPALRPRALSNAVLFALVAGQVCLHSSMAGLRLALPLMMLRQGGWAGWPAEAAAGVLLGLFAVAPVALALPAGRWADRRGYHKPVSAAVAMGMVGGLLGCLAASLSPLLAGAGQMTLSWLAAAQALLLLLAATLIGTGCNVGLITMQRTAGRLAQADVPAGRSSAGKNSAELKRVFSWIGLAPALGNVGGPLLVGLLIDSVGFAWACAAMSLLPLGKAWWARRIPREPPRAALLSIDEPASRADVSASTVAGHGGTAASGTAGASGRPVAGSPGGVRGLLAVPGIRRLLTINWFFSASWDLHGFVVPLLGHERGMSASAIGTVLGLFAASVATVRVIIPLLANHLQERQVMVGAMTVVASVFAVYPLAHSALQMSACAIVLGLALGSVQPMIMTALHHLAPPERQGEAIALRSAFINLSSAVLPVCFGLVGAALGASLLFRGMAVVVVLGLPLALRLKLGD